MAVCIARKELGRRGEGWVGRGEGWARERVGREKDVQWKGQCCQSEKFSHLSRRAWEGGAFPVRVPLRGVGALSCSVSCGRPHGDGGMLYRHDSSSRRPPITPCMYRIEPLGEEEGEKKERGSSTGHAQL